MNRADKLLSVLQDGREHSRADVFQAYGFMLTNNAASELRARGYEVEHRKKDGLDTYRLALEATDPALLGVGPIDTGSVASSAPDLAAAAEDGALDLHPDQLSLGVAA